MSAYKPTVAIIILAAGASTRMGTPKQLLPYRERSLLRHITIEVIASQCYPIVVVLGAQAEQIKPEVNYLDLHVVENQQWAEGIGTSIRAGIAFVSCYKPKHKGNDDCPLRSDLSFLPSA